MTSSNKRDGTLEDSEGNDPAEFSGGQMTPTSLRSLYVVLDVFLSIVAGALALLIWNLVGKHPISISWFLNTLHWLPILSAGTLLTFALSGCYMTSSSIHFRASFFQVLRGLSVLFVLYYTIYFFAPRGALPRLVVLFYALFAFPLFITARRMITWGTQRPELQQNAILLSSSEELSRVKKLLQDHNLSSIRLVGVYPVGENRDFEPEPSSFEPDHPLKILDPDRDLLRYARRFNAGDVVIFRNRTEFPDKVLNQLVDCHQKGMSITSGLELIEELSGRLPLSYAREHPERLFPSRRHEGLFYRTQKRSMDVAGALVGLLVFVPLFPFLAAGIKLTSTGPVFFQQERTGKFGDPFVLIKLRTMVENAEEESGAQWAQEDDPRITSFGKFLRLTHLDEFPQFWNVLKGDMSLVGPRPERPEIEAELTDPNPFFKLRHSVKPGVTGWATIKNQYVDSLEKAERRLEYDVYYIEHQSIWLDLHILFETIWELATFGGR